MIRKDGVAPALGCVSLLLWTGAFAGTPQFTVEQILSAPFASGIVVAPNGRDFAWVSNAAGRRNVWLARAAPGKSAPVSQPVTHY